MTTQSSIGTWDCPTLITKPAKGRLDTGISFDPGSFAPFTNTLTLIKLSLLDGPTLDQVMSDLTGTEYSYYQFFENANVMTVGLTELVDPPDPPEPPPLSPVAGQIDLTPSGGHPNDHAAPADVSDDGRYVTYYSGAEQHCSR